jgi:citrate synthase
LIIIKYMLLTARQVADRLGIKIETVYAYVSRGTLTSHPSADGRTSRFRSADVEELARRGRPRRASATMFEVEIDTALTSIDERGLRFRGHDAVALATTATFEQVAELLWSGALPDRHHPWIATDPDIGSVEDLATASDDAALAAIDRVRLVVASAATRDPFRNDLRPEAVAACGRSLVATIVDSFPVAADGRSPRLALTGLATPLRATIAGRLWAHLVPGRPRPELVTVVNAALVLLVDHELAASTFAARVAASTRADPYAVVSTGLGPFSGPFHGGASVAARAVIDRAAEPGPGASAALADALAQHGAYPGFGHRLYPDGDPRAIEIMRLLRLAVGGSRAMAVIDEVVATAQRRAPIHPNSDFALAALGYATGMPVASGDVIFTVARTAGWLAHAIEEYQEPPLRFRPRARYVGPQ